MKLQHKAWALILIVVAIGSGGIGLGQRYLVGESFDRLEHERAELDRIRDALTEWKPVRAELISYTKAGKEFWLELDIVPVADENGWYTHLIAIERDITDSKFIEGARDAMEAQFRELQIMEAIGTLAGDIAHDFNNIIATMLGNAELARRNLDRDHAARESIEEIMKAGRRARELVQQILTFSRRQSAVMMPIPFGPIVEEVARMLGANLSANIHIKVSVAPDAPLVRADSTQMMQVLMNLGTNAIQAMLGRAGSLHMAIETVASTELPLVAADAGLHAQPAMRLTVRDSGPGMDKATLDRMFEPFFTTKPPGEGTGLGLAVVHGIIQSHGGRVHVSSTLGIGTCFTIDLPGVESTRAVNQLAGTAPTVTSAPIQTKSGAGRHILYLDDDDALVFLVRRLLELDGFTVSSHYEQSEAIAAVKANPFGFDLVVTDFNMPGMNGIEVIQEMLAINPALQTAIASGFIGEGLTQTAKNAGVSKLIFKESAIEDFCAVILNLINETS